MPNFDDRTQRGWPLPYNSNTLQFDVERLRETLRLIDEELGNVEANTKTIINQNIAGLEERQYILDARMDTIAGQTTRDTEVLDARVDSQGTVHSNLGEFLRTLHSRVLLLINELERDKANLELETSERINSISAAKQELWQLYLDGEEQFNTFALDTQRNLRILFQDVQSNLDAISQETLTRDAQDSAILQNQNSQLSFIQEQVDENTSTILKNTFELLSETEERKTEDEKLAENLNSKIETRSSQLQNAIDDEAQTRQSEDEYLHELLTSETQTRIAQDDVLQNEIVQEVKTRELENTDVHNEVKATGDFLQEQLDDNSAGILKHTLELKELAENSAAQAQTLAGEIQTRETETTELKQSLNREFQTRQSELTDVHGEIEAQGKFLQEQLDENAAGILRNSLELASEADTRKSADDELARNIAAQSENLNSEIAQHSLETRSELQALGQFSQVQHDTLAGEILSLNFHRLDDLHKAEALDELRSRRNDELTSHLQSQINQNSQAALILTDALNFEAAKLRNLEQVVRNLKAPVDWSNSDSLAIPEPRCAVVNFSGLTSMPTSKTADIPAVLEFWDRQGNFFRKNILCSAQGNSSLGYIKKNVKLDLLNQDGSEFSLKFGNWVPQDGFHLKAYYTDFFRGVAVASYKFWDEVMRFNGLDIDRPYKKALNLQLDTGALCHPDGFPCIVFLNGEFYGIFSWQIKKQRKNYQLDKSTVEHIHLDGTLSSANFWNGNINWGAFEIRNPNKLFTMDGKKYNGDAPKELIDETSENFNATNNDHVRTAQVKRYILNFVQRFIELRAQPSREKFEAIFDWQNQRDYLIFSDVVKNSDGFGKNWQWTSYDGVHWFVNAYDLDMSFGGMFNGSAITAPLNGHITTSTAIPSGFVVQLYKSELEQRYRELRDAGIISVDNILAKLNDWTARIGSDNYSLEFQRWPDSPCLLNYNDSIYRVKSWLETQIANLDALYRYQAPKIRGRAEILAEVENIAALHDEQLRQDISSQAQIRQADYRGLQEQIDQLSNLFLQKILETDSTQPVVSISRQPESPDLQEQIDDLAAASLFKSCVDYKLLSTLHELGQRVREVYQAVADTGSLTYKGARIASSSEIGEMLTDVLTGSNSGEISSSDIPEELKGQVASSSEISEMLNEIFNSRS